MICGRKFLVQTPQREKLLLEGPLLGHFSNTDSVFPRVGLVAISQRGQAVIARARTTRRETPGPIWNRQGGREGVLRGWACNPCGTVLRQVSVKSHVSPFTAPCDALSVIPSPSCSPTDASTALPPHCSSAELPQTSPTGAPPLPFSPRRAMEVLQRVLPKVRAALGKKDYQICDVCLAPS